MKKDRARDLGIPFDGTTGNYNAITDIKGIKVGFSTLTDQSKSMRTGVTAIIPDSDRKGMPRPLAAGQFSLNGNGEMTGCHWIHDAGYFYGPICLTNSHGIGAVHTGATKWMIETYGEFFKNDHAWAMPVIAETYDGVLNDMNAMFVEPRHAIEALNGAKSGPIAEGAIGGGNGMIAYEFCAGTGTSSRIVRLADQEYTVATLVQANHGLRPWLTIAGRSMWPMMKDNLLFTKEMGSIVVILATDAPMNGIQLRQMAKRASIGIGRAGTPGGNSSGDIFLAFSTANFTEKMPLHDNVIITQNIINNEYLDPFYMAAVQAIDEAVINALVAGQEAITFKPKGLHAKTIDKVKLQKMFSDV